MRFIFTYLLIALLMGCASVPSASEFRMTSARLATASPGLEVDARAEFRSIFCAVFQAANKAEPATPDDCNQYLWRLKDERGPLGKLEALADINPDLQVYMVGGAFSQCFGEASIAFRKSIERLLAANVNVHSVPVVSRSVANSNARIIAKTIRETLTPAPVD